MMSIQEYRKEVDGYMRTVYKNNDAAHCIEHARAVCDEALRINTKMKLGLDEKQVICAAYAHDMYTAHRDTHHQMACTWALNAPWQFLMELGWEGRANVATAVLEHRASWPHERQNELSQLIAVADRGKPDYQAYVERSMTYAMSKLGKTLEEAKVHGVTHIGEKFHRDGYAFKNMPLLYFAVYDAEVHDLWQKIDEANGNVDGVWDEARFGENLHGYGVTTEDNEPDFEYTHEWVANASEPDLTVKGPNWFEGNSND